MIVEYQGRRYEPVEFYVTGSKTSNGPMLSRSLSDGHLVSSPHWHGLDVSFGQGMSAAARILLRGKQGIQTGRRRTDDEEEFLKWQTRNQYWGVETRKRNPNMILGAVASRSSANRVRRGDWLRTSVLVQYCSLELLLR